MYFGICVIVLVSFFTGKYRGHSVEYDHWTDRIHRVLYVSQTVVLSPTVNSFYRCLLDKIDEDEMKEELREYMEKKKKKTEKDTA